MPGLRLAAIHGLECVRHLIRGGQSGPLGTAIGGNRQHRLRPRLAERGHGVDQLLGIRMRVGQGFVDDVNDAHGALSYHSFLSPVHGR